MDRSAASRWAALHRQAGSVRDQTDSNAADRRVWIGTACIGRRRRRPAEFRPEHFLGPSAEVAAPWRVGRGPVVAGAGAVSSELQDRIVDPYSRAGSRNFSDVSEGLWKQRAGCLAAYFYAHSCVDCSAVPLTKPAKRQPFYSLSLTIARRLYDAFEIGDQETQSLGPPQANEKGVFAGQHLGHGFDAIVVP